MPSRDLAACGRHPPNPRHEPLAFWAAARGGGHSNGPADLVGVMARDPYFPTQDNGAGSALHAAVTHNRLDMVHFLLSESCRGNSNDNKGGKGAAAAVSASSPSSSSPAPAAAAAAAAPLTPAVNQRDFARGFTPLHRAAALAHAPGGGYLEIYEYLLSRGADPNIPSDDFDPYLDPGAKLPRDLAADEATKEKLLALERRYGAVPKAPRAHPQLGCFWTLYDHGPDAVLAWEASKVVEHPEEARRARDKAARRAEREARRARRDGGGGVSAVAVAASAVAAVKPTTTTTAPKPSSSSSSSPPTVYLFPGQGSQQLGKMLSRAAAARSPAVASLLRTAERVLGFDLLSLVEEGGAMSDRLDDTRYAQTALFVAGMAALEELKERQRREQAQAEAEGAAAALAAGEGEGGAPASAPPPPPPPPAPTALAGLSLGEYCALVAAGALSFEDGLRVVKARGEAMAAAAASGGRPHGMLSVVGLDDAKLGALVAEARAEAAAAAKAAKAGGDNNNINENEDDGETVLEVANLLFPEGRVVSGHMDALELLRAKAEAAGALKATALKVAGAFHTRLMRPAARALRAALDAAETLKPLSEDAPLVISNVTADFFPREDAAAVKDLLCRQLVEPVRWEEGLRRALALGGRGAAGAGAGAAGAGASSAPAAVVRLYELGPGAQLKAMVRRMDTAAWKAMANVAAI